MSLSRVKNIFTPTKINSIVILETAANFFFFFWLSFIAVSSLFLQIDFSARVIGSWVPNSFYVLYCSTVGVACGKPSFPEFLRYKYANSAKPIWRQMLCL